MSTYCLSQLELQMLETGEVELVKFLLVLIGVGEEELIRGVGQFTNHSANSNNCQSVCCFEDMSDSTLRQITIFLLLALLIRNNVQKWI